MFMNVNGRSWAHEREHLKKFRAVLLKVPVQYFVSIQNLILNPVLKRLRFAIPLHHIKP